MNKNIFYKRTWLTSLVCTIFIAYPNIAWIRCDLCDIDPSDHLKFTFTFVFRFVFFWILQYILLKFNDKKLNREGLG